MCVRESVWCVVCVVCVCLPSNVSVASRSSSGSGETVSSTLSTEFMSSAVKLGKIEATVSPGLTLPPVLSLTRHEKRRGVVELWAIAVPNTTLSGELAGTSASKATRGTVLLVSGL